MAAKMAGNDFTLEDFLQQMMMLRKMGPIGGLLGMLPGAGQMKEALANVDDRDIDRTAAIIQSMTPGRAGRTQDHQCLPPAAHRPRLRLDGVAGQRAWSTGSSRPAR